MNGHRDTRVMRALRQLLLLSYLLCPCTYVGLDWQGNFHSSFPFAFPM